MQLTVWAERSFDGVRTLFGGASVPRVVVAACVALALSVAFYIGAVSRHNQARVALLDVQRRMQRAAQYEIALRSRLEQLRSPGSLEKVAESYGMVRTSEKNVWRLP